MGAPVTSIMRLCHIIWESSILLKIVIQTGRITDETHKTCWGKIANVLSQKSVQLNRAYVWWSESESFSRFSWVRLFVTPWTVAHQAPLSMGFSRQEYWSGLPFPSPGDLQTQGLNPSLLYWSQILYLLSHQGSHIRLINIDKKNGTNQSATCGQERMEEPVKPTIWIQHRSCIIFMLRDLCRTHR